MTRRVWKFALLTAAGALLVSCAATRPADKKEGMNPEARLSVAEAAERTGDTDLAATMYAAAANEAPSDNVVLQRSAEGLARLGRLDDATALLTRRLQGSARQPDLLQALGSVQVLAGQATQAEAKFTEVLAAKPDDVRALADKGVALDLQKRHAEAQVLYRKALTFAPNDPVICNDLALSLLLSGHAQEARQVLLPFRDATDVPERIRINLGILEAAGGDSGEAKRLLGTTVDAQDLAMLTQAIQAGSRTP